MKAQFARPYSMNAQRGAALVVGLIMLMLLTLIGVAGMRESLLQQKMTSNTKDREVALQAAESALRAAEMSLNTPMAPPMTNSNGLYDLTTVAASVFDARKTSKSETAFWMQNWDWDNADSVKYPYALEGVVTDKPPRYVIEKLDVALSSRAGYAKKGGACSVVCSEDLVDDYIVTPDPVSDYRITVKASGMTEDAEVLIQSTFRRDKE